MKILFRYLVRISLVLVFLFVSLGPVWAMERKDRPVELIDRPAPSFSLSDLEGRGASLDDYKGKNLILFFWTTWCPFCRASLVDLEKRYTSIRAKDIEVLSINIGESTAKIKDFLDRYPVSFPVLLDSDNQIAERYHIIGIPTYVLISADAKIKAMDNALGSRYWEAFR